jgi:hypothetical protein
MASNSGYYTNTSETILIYFSDGYRRFGTPYYDYLSVTNTSPDKVNISLYPNPTADLLHLSITSAGLTNTELIITDILGQEIYSLSVAQSETTHDISRLASGIYTWRVVQNNSIIKTGKVVKQ